MTQIESSSSQVVPASPAWSGRTKRTVVIGALVLVGLLIWQITDVLPLIVIALVVSYLLNPLTRFLERRITRGRRGAAILLTFILVLVGFMLVILVVLPAIFRQVNDFAAELPTQLETLQSRIEEALSQPLTFNGQPILIDGQPLVPLDQLTAALGENPTDALQLENFDFIGTIRGFLSTVTGPTFSFIGRAFSVLINMILLLTMMFYLLKDGAKFVDSIVRVVPPDYQHDARRLMHELGEVWNAYLRGQIILSSFVGILVFIVASLIGLPNAPVLGLISFTLEFIPNIGPLIALIPAALLGLLSESSTIPGLSGLGFAAVVIVLWLIIQNVQAIFITPRVMGDSLDLHPIVVIIGVLVGASLAGALGVILAAPTIATLRLFGLYAYWKLTDKPVFPDAPTDSAHKNPFRGLFALFQRQRTASGMVKSSETDRQVSPQKGINHDAKK